MFQKSEMWIISTFYLVDSTFLKAKYNRLNTSK